MCLRARLPGGGSTAARGCGPGGGGGPPGRNDDGDGCDEIMAISPSGVAILKLLPGGLTVLMSGENGSTFGADSWLLDTAVDHFHHARDYDDDGRFEVLVSSPWGVGILRLDGDTLTPILLRATGAHLAGGWVLDASRDWPGSAARYGDGGKTGILVSSPRGIAILECTSGGLECLTIMPDGTDLGGWILDAATDSFGHGT